MEGSDDVFPAGPVPSLTRKVSNTDGAARPQRMSLRNVAQSMTTAISMRRHLTRRATLRSTCSSKMSEAKAKLENTYKTEPDEGKTFPSCKVQKLAETILEQRLHNKTYSHATANSLAKEITSVIKISVKELNIPRHKIVVLASVGQCTDQGMEMASRCLWNDSTDNFACASYSNGSLMAVATIYGVYYE